MSVVLDTKIALLAALGANPILRNLLATDPHDPTAPAIFEATLNTTAPVYPCATWRLPDHRPDARFQPTEAEGGGASPIIRTALEIELWDDRPADNDRIEQIADAVCAVLDGQVLNLSGGGRAFRNQLTVRSNTYWDDRRKVHFVLLRFSLRIHAINS